MSGRYTRQEGYALEIQNDADELKIRADRKLGELLRETVQHGGDLKSKSQPATLISLPEGISRSQSSRWQQCW